jgi:HNH endonuclease
MADFSKNSPDKIRYLQALPYQEYLASVWWRRRRHLRLQKAKGRCERCGAVTSIADVHHIHYDRRGDERDSDLEVVCRDCHRKLHVEESRKQNINVYLMIAQEALRLDRPTSADAFKDSFRTRCADLHLVIDHRFDDAMSIVWSKKEVSLVSAAKRERFAQVAAAVGESPPISHTDAVDLCKRLGLKFPFQSMPQAYGVGAGVAAIRARAVARLKAAVCPSCGHAGAQGSRALPGLVWCESCRWRWMLPLESKPAPASAE